MALIDHYGFEILLEGGNSWTVSKIMVASIIERGKLCSQPLSVSFLLMSAPQRKSRAYVSPKGQVVCFCHPTAQVLYLCQPYSANFVLMSAPQRKFCAYFSSAAQVSCLQQLIRAIFVFLTAPKR